jgi:hypothetical protein
MFVPRIGGENSTYGMEGEGVRGLKALGVKELTYKTAFLACSVQVRLPPFLFSLECFLAH